MAGRPSSQEVLIQDLSHIPRKAWRDQNTEYIYVQYTSHELGLERWKKSNNIRIKISLYALNEKKQLVGTRIPLGTLGLKCEMV